MDLTTLKISKPIGRDLRIAAAYQGVLIQSLTERYIREGLDRDLKITVEPVSQRTHQ